MAIDIFEVKKLINENLDGIKGLKDVAHRLDVSQETLRKNFLRKEGISLSDYLTSRRVEAMIKMLVETDKPCFLIGFEAGYRREDTAAKVFKRVTGITMREYKNKHRDGRRKR